MNNMTVLFTFTGPISPDARHRAEQLYRQQATPQKGEQVRLNTLSVSFVNSYLQCMGFETDLEKSDSWNPVQQTLMDVADLLLKNLGRLECRPVLGDTQFVYVPPEVQSNRIGYVVVQIGKSFREATLLGFIQQVSTELLPISQLQPLENLLEYLEYLSQVKQAELAFQSLPGSKVLVNLQQWLENIFEAGWQEISSVLDTQPADIVWSLRGTGKEFVSRGKLIDLGKSITAQSVTLVVSLTPKNSQEIDIFVEVHPKSGETYLPPNLQLSVLDSEGAAIMEVQARSTNKNIQLQFSGEPRERFSIKVALEDVSIIEDFVI
jgi:hypothetical protein